MRILITLIVAVTLAGCNPVAVPNDPGTGSPVVDCFKDAGKTAIADAIARVNAVIAIGVAAGATQAVILKELGGLALDVGPDVLACAVLYVASKFSYDVSMGGPPSSAKGATIARAFIEQGGYVYATAPRPQ